MKFVIKIDKCITAAIICFFILLKPRYFDFISVLDNLFDMGRVCQVFCVSFKKIFWGGEPPHLYHPTLLNDTLLKYFGNISNRVSCQ